MLNEPSIHSKFFRWICKTGTRFFFLRKRKYLGHHFEVIFCSPVEISKCSTHTHFMQIIKQKTRVFFKHKEFCSNLVRINVSRCSLCNRFLATHFLIKYITTIHSNSKNRLQNHFSNIRSIPNRLKNVFNSAPFSIKIKWR